MTLAEVEILEKATNTPEQAASDLGFHPQCLRIQARINPSKLGFSICHVGSRVRIPRLPFILFVKGLPRGL